MVSESMGERRADEQPAAGAPSMAVDLGGVRMANPICTAAGTFGYAAQVEGFFDVARLGAVTCKGVAAEPWSGNPAPRLCETCSGIINSVGLENPGVRAFVDDYGEYLEGLERRGCRVIVQAAGHSPAELAESVRLFDELATWASAIEVNVSCPNLELGGRPLGGTAADAAEVMRAVRPLTSKPLLVKMAPANVAEVARALEAEGADALSLINTIPAMSIDVRTRRSRLSRPTGGLSGPAIHAIAVRMVWEAASAVSIPINGMGGVETVEDAAEMILAGATAVTVGTATLHDPLAAARIADGLPAWVASQGATDVNDLIGAFEC